MACQLRAGTERRDCGEDAMNSWTAGGAVLLWPMTVAVENV